MTDFNAVAARAEERAAERAIDALDHVNEEDRRVLTYAADQILYHPETETHRNHRLMMDVINDRLRRHDRRRQAQQQQVREVMDDERADD